MQVQVVLPVKLQQDTICSRPGLLEGGQDILKAVEARLRKTRSPAHTWRERTMCRCWETVRGPWKRNMRTPSDPAMPRIWKRGGGTTGVLAQLDGQMKCAAHTERGSLQNGGPGRPRVRLEDTS